MILHQIQIFFSYETTVNTPLCASGYPNGKVVGAYPKQSNHPDLVWFSKVAFMGK